jgi:hypothetical protein
MSFRSTPPGPSRSTQAGPLNHLRAPADDRLARLPPAGWRFSPRPAQPVPGNLWASGPTVTTRSRASCRRRPPRHPDFRRRPSGRITLRCDDPSLPTGPENLVVRAAERLGRNRGALAGRPSTSARPSRRRPGWPAARATRRRPCRPWIGSGTCRPPRIAGRPGRGDGSDVAFFRRAGAVCRGGASGAAPPAGPFHFVLICRRPAEQRRFIPPGRPPERPGRSAGPGGPGRRRPRAWAEPVQPLQPAPSPCQPSSGRGGPGNLGPSPRRAPDERQRLAYSA